MPTTTQEPEHGAMNEPLTPTEWAARERLLRIGSAWATRPLYVDGDALNQDCLVVVHALDRLNRAFRLCAADLSAAKEQLAQLSQYLAQGLARERALSKASGLRCQSKRNPQGS